MSFRLVFAGVIVFALGAPLPKVVAQGVELSEEIESRSTRTDDEGGGSDAMIRTPLELPGSVDLRPFLPKPGNQRSMRNSDGHSISNSCVAWSIAYASYSCQIVQQRGRGVKRPIDIFSPMFLMTEISDASNGMQAMKALNFVKDRGCASRAAMKRGQSKASAEAMTFRAIDYERVFKRKNIKRWVADGYPVMMIIDLDEGFRNDVSGSAPYLWSGMPKREYHAVTAVGYDDTKRALLLMNSWGEAWKDGGFCWVSYDNLNAITRGNWCVEAWVLKVKESAPFNASCTTGSFGPYGYERQLKEFQLRADGRVYDSGDEAISPRGWNIVGLTSNDDQELFMIKKDKTIYQYKHDSEKTWIHLTTGEIKRRKVDMMAGNKDFPLHVLADDGTVFEYVDGANPWKKVVSLGRVKTADLRRVKRMGKFQIRAVTTDGDVYVRHADDETWALAP